MMKIRIMLKNLIYSIGFLFRPVTPVAVSFFFLILTSAVLVAVIVNLDEKGKLYQVLLSILTGVTASLLIAIMTELYNNYRFNTKRQRELREYFRCVARHEIYLKSIMKVGSELDNTLGDGRAYAVFRKLGEIIPTLREALNNRDYLYRKEINEIDDILYNYDEIIEVIWINLLPEYMSLITRRHDESSDGYAEDNACNMIREGMADEKIIDDESIMDYPKLYNFLKTEAKYYVKSKYNSDFYDKDPEQLKSVIEKAIFFEHHIFDEYFEVIDARSESNKLINDEKTSYKKKRFENSSDRISQACREIDNSMIKLQKMLAREPYIWTMASYKEKEKFDTKV